VLIHYRPRQAGEVDRLARLGHSHGEGQRLGRGESAQVRGHQPRRHLVVGDIAGDERPDEPRQLVRAMGLAIAFPGDDIVRVHVTAHLSACACLRFHALKHVASVGKTNAPSIRLRS